MACGLFGRCDTIIDNTIIDKPHIQVQDDAVQVFLLHGGSTCRRLLKSGGQAAAALP